MDEGEAFIRDAAIRRGIDPDKAVTVARMEGGTAPPGLVGKFDTGWSFWQFQLHYGGAEYPQFGTVAGMGNGFTKLTGWQPGDPAAWRDAARYALNRVKTGGWGPWYGAKKAGIVGFDGVNRDHPWNASSETWDYETRTAPMVTYNPAEPPHRQEDEFDCSQESAEWALFSVGRTPQEGWIEPTMIAEGVMSRERGLEDATGAGLAAFLTRHYGEFGYRATNEPIATFDALASEAGRYPIMIGGRNWGGPGLGHWSGLASYDAARNVLVLKNPATGPRFGAETLDRKQFDARGPWSMVRLTHPDLIANPTPQPPTPVPPADPRDARIAELEAQVAERQARIDAFVNAVAYLGDDIGDKLEAAARELRRVRTESVGARPA